MFTGLVREIGTLRRSAPGPGVRRLSIHAPRLSRGLGVGDSLAVNGICLTVTGVRGNVVTVDAAVETLRVTTLRRWRIGRKLHLEPALEVGQALDGHFVQGHVDGVGRVVASKRRGASLLMTIVCGNRLAGWLMPKGSVAVDGVSLTADEGPHSDRFTVNLIPHTLSWTVFGDIRPGQEVNLEMDVLVKAARTGAAAETAAADGTPVRSLASILDRGFNRRNRSS